jgi:transcription antitermination protein NusB
MGQGYCRPRSVTPAKAGVCVSETEIPAFAGMTFQLDRFEKMSAPRKAPIARSAARLGAVQALYQMDIASADLAETLAQFSSRAKGDDFDDGQCGEADFKHLREVVEGAVREQALIDVTVDKQLDKNWPIHRVNAILRAVLRAGAFEIMFKENVPAKVAINEYVNVAGAFFDGEEPALANAVLNALGRARRPEEFTA